jgi:multicomponent Na+:H+ antiporter subunit F
MLDSILVITLVILSMATIGCFLRLVKGPSLPDRVIALDLIGIHLIAIVAVLSMWLRTDAFLDMILVIGILAFMGTVGFAKFIEKGRVIERDTTSHNDR